MALLIFILLLVSPENETIIRYFLNLNKSRDIKVSEVNIPSGVIFVKIKDGQLVESRNNTAYLPFEGTKYNKPLNSFAKIKFIEFTEVVIAERDISRNEILDKNMFIVKRIEKGTSARTIIDPEKIIGYKSRVKIKKGSVLYTDQVAKIPAITQGSKIVGYLNKGNISVEIEVTAKKDGLINEIIPVINYEGKTYKGKVINSLMVEILL